MADIDFKTLIFTIINFAVAVLILQKLLFKPVLKLLDKRKAEIDADLLSAAEDKAEAKKLKKELEEAKFKQKAEYKARMASALREGEQKQAALLESARKEAQDMLIAAEEDIKTQRMRSLRKQQRVIATLAVELASRVLSKELKADDHAKIIDNFMQELGDTAKAEEKSPGASLEAISNALEGEGKGHAVKDMHLKPSTASIVLAAEDGVETPEDSKDKFKRSEDGTESNTTYKTAKYKTEDRSEDIAKAKSSEKTEEGQ